MVYHDDQMPPITHYPLPFDPWDDPNHGASRIKPDLWRAGHDVPLNAIYGVKAGM